MRIDCYKCIHYKMTWDRKFPHACNLLEFRSRKMPSVVAYESTGAFCVGFEPKGGDKARTPEGQQTDHVIIDIRKQ